jgi:hypothetical protein
MADTPPLPEEVAQQLLKLQVRESRHPMLHTT